MKNRILICPANYLILIVFSFWLTACAGQQTKTEPEQKPQREFDFVRVEKGILNIYDPWEPMNRTLYNFNAGFDRYVFLPTVNGYRKVTPDLLETGISNFFENLREIHYFVNNLLQLELKSSAISLGRFVINSTVGVAGFWDQATPLGLYSQKEDFGQTLGKWGVGGGPYLVLPVFGPSNLRDTGGLITDFLVETEIDMLNIEDDANKDDIRIALILLNAIDQRKNTAFHYYETGSPFEYELMRYFYTKFRGIEIER